MLAEQIKEIATERLRHMPVAAEDLMRIAAEVHRVEVIARKVLEREAAGFAPFSAYPCGCAVEDEHDHTRQTRWCSFHAKMRNRLDELEAREQLNEKIAQAQRQPGIADLERLAELEAREQARLSARAYSHSPSGHGDLATRAGYGDLAPGESREQARLSEYAASRRAPCPKCGSIMCCCYMRDLAGPECEELR